MVTGWSIVAGLAVVVLALALWWQVRAGPPGGQRAHPPARPFPTPDGTWVASRGEQAIATWLTRRAIAYTYEPTIAGGLTPDFLVDGTRIVIEYWGLAGQPGYEARMQEKIDRYEEHGYDVVSLFPIHLGVLDEVLEGELDARGVPGARNANP